MDRSTAPTFCFTITTGPDTAKLVPSFLVAEDVTGCKCCGKGTEGGWWCVTGDVYSLACVMGMIEEGVIHEDEAVMVPTAGQVADRDLPYGIN